jgi:hypothetical protein
MAVYAIRFVHVTDIARFKLCVLWYAYALEYCDHNSAFRKFSILKHV